MATALNQLRYDRLVAYAEQRGMPAGYFERHHIVPRSCGGSNAKDNIVALTAREHFLAHWLLYRIYRTPATARAFKLMVHDQRLRRGRDYAEARQVMAEAMQGDKNVSRRPEVRAKLVANNVSTFRGKKRPEHAALMRSKGLIAGEKNPWYGTGARQTGAKNHMARAVNGVHIYAGACQWHTLRDAATALGVTIQAISQAIKYELRSKGWRLEKAS